MGFFTKEEVPPAPDMSGVINQSREMAQYATQVGKETLDWARTEVAENKQNISEHIDRMVNDADTARGMVQRFQDISNAQSGLQEYATDIADKSMAHAAVQQEVQGEQRAIQQQQLGEQGRQLENQQTQLGLQQDFRQDQQQQQQHAEALYDQYSKTYEPAQARFMADAEAYGTQQRIDQARAGAAAGVGEQFQGARDAATRQLESYGVKPSDTRMAALDLGTRIKEAATKAAASEAAARAQEDRAFQLRDMAIKQGAQLPGQATAATNAATAIGSNVSTQGGVANQAGAVGAQYGSLANQAGSNAVAAGNAATGAINAGTGAVGTGVSAGQGATQAQTGALAAGTGAANIEQGAGNLTNQTLQTGSNVIGKPGEYLTTGQGATTAAGNLQAAEYKGEMDQFKAEQSNTTGFGQLLGTAAGVATSMFAPELKAATKTLFSAEGGAIPMSTSPSNGQAEDDVKAQLTAGEFVMPKDVTAWYGEKFFQQLIAKAQKEKGNAQAKPAIGPGQPGPPAVVSRPSPAIPMGA